ncbi:hypothetical protein RhiirA1_400576 [Rhizophagus irregularis]|uniref:Uncharacterized protein n=1 Tax=Rhizophagus irregularis TaxID=588596 RepID=A0A2I1F5C7_9GLOM|nr:hypothetical protein RhiirA1_400576 [Rhizophagus irregularis]PKY29582.1 hypothetical protein RhiirB3_391922 [Rhizophagus irregularis]
MSLRSKGIMFLDQVITPDSAYLLEEYNKIKESLQNKQGRIPRWYNFLKNHLTISSTNNHLNIELNKPIIQNPRVERLRPPPISVEVQNHTGYGRAIMTTNYSPSGPMLFAEHWIKIPINTSIATPRSCPNLLQPCPGCKLHFPYYVGDNRINCILKIPYPRIIKIYALQKHNIQQYASWLPGRLLNNVKVIKHNHEHYKIVAYNDYLIRNNLLPSRTSLLDTLDNASPANKTYQLITSLIKESVIQADLWSLAQNVQNHNYFEIFTDGSFNRSPSTNEFHMGFGWHIPNIPDFNAFYRGALKHLPSSTKAEIMAILTAIIILLPSNATILILTDSQAAIDGFNKSAQLRHISP